MYASTMSPRTASEQDPARLAKLGIAAGVLLMFCVAALFLGSEGVTFVVAGATVLPFTALAVLAYLGAEYVWARVTAILWLIGLVLGYAFFTAAAGLLGLPGLQVTTGSGLSAGQWTQVGGILLGVMITAALGGLTAIPAVREGLARRLPFDPRDFVDSIALIAVVSLLLIGFVPLLVLAAPPLLTMLTNSSTGADLANSQSSAEQLRTQVYTLVWTIPSAILAVGYGVRRSLGAALERLGLVRPTLRQVLAGLGIAVLAVIASRVLDMGIGWLWPTMGWPQTNAAAFNSLISFALSPVGAIVLGVTAGLGEEVAVRGVLQPRMGILLSNLFFTSLHAFQYNWDALLSVFLLGLLMGFVRQRTNTSTSAIVHGTYDFLLVALTLVAIPWLSG
jgi:membrane protease YdiL (CAAX protease family)